MSMVLVNACGVSSSIARFWASLNFPCLQGCSWPWRAVAGMHVALRIGQELPRLKLFRSLDFARLTGLTPQSPTRVDQFPIIHCKEADVVGGRAVWWNTQITDLDQLNHSSTRGVKGNLNEVRRCEFAAGGGGHSASTSGPRGPNWRAAHQAVKAWWEARKWRQKLYEATVSSRRGTHAHELLWLRMTRKPPKTSAQEKRG